MEVGQRAPMLVREREQRRGLVELALVSQQQAETIDADQSPWREAQ